MTPQEKALDTLDGMKEIVEHEMIERGSYSTAEIIDRDLYEKGAVCGGRRYCAIGAMVVAYGIPSHQESQGRYPWEQTVDFGMAVSGGRRSYYKKHPGLDIAHDALNEAADQYAKQYGLGMPGGTSAIEDLFESNPFFDDTEEGRVVLCGIIDNAKAIILDEPINRNLGSPYALAD